MKEEDLDDLPEPESGISRTRRRKFMVGASGLLIFLLAFAGFLLFNFTMVQVSGASMLPNFKDGERVLVSKAYWLVGGVRNGDVIVLKQDDGQYVIKRVYRRGGEKVEFRYVPDRYSIVNGPYIVPEGKVYVLGDNKSVSEDSRIYGPVETEKIIGKVVMKL